MENKKIVVFGSFVVDLMGRGKSLPRAAETVKGSYFKMGPGGKGFNQGVAAHKAGANIKMITKLGSDMFATIATDAMDELGMDRENIFYSETEATGIALIMVQENDSQNQILVVPGACDNITSEDIEKVSDVIRESDYLLTQLETNLTSIVEVIEQASANKLKVILNPAPIQVIPEDLYSKIDIITPNEVEAEELSGIKVTDEASAELAATWFRNKGVTNVIITMGSKGVYVLTEKEAQFIPAFKVKAIDTTGAGDAFNGGLVAALSFGYELLEAVKYGNAVGGLSVQKIGTTPSMPTSKEIAQFIMEHEGDYNA